MSILEPPLVGGGDIIGVVFVVIVFNVPGDLPLAKLPISLPCLSIIIVLSPKSIVSIPFSNSSFILITYYQ